MESPARYALHAPKEILYGWGALDRLDEQAGEEALLLIDANCRARFLAPARAALERAGLRTRVLEMPAVEPTIDSVTAALREAGGVLPGLLAAVGGGSVLDTAKMLRVAAVLPDDGPAGWFTPGRIRGTATGTRLIAVPTTSGTGSEVTCAAVLVDPATRLKRVAISPALVPDCAILDPALPMSLPPAVTAQCGFDALVHALEAATCRLATEFTFALAAGAARLLLEHLETAFRDGGDRGAREKVHYAASMAGLAISNSSVGLAHSLDQVGPLFGLPHGRALAAIYPAVMEYNRREAEGAFARLARACGLAGGPAVEGEPAGPSGGAGREAADALARRVRELAARLGLPMTIAEAGIGRRELEPHLDRITETAAEAFATRQNPRPAGPAEIRRLLDCACTGRAVDF